LIYGEKQLNTANLRSKQGNQLRGVKIKKNYQKKKNKKFEFQTGSNKNLQENEFSRLNQGLDNLGQFWKEVEEKGSKVFFCENNIGEKKTGSSQLLNKT